MSSHLDTGTLCFLKPSVIQTSAAYTPSSPHILLTKMEGVSSGGLKEAWHIVCAQETLRRSEPSCLREARALGACGFTVSLGLDSRLLLLHAGRSPSVPLCPSVFLSISASACLFLKHTQSPTYSEGGQKHRALGLSPAFRFWTVL